MTPLKNGLVGVFGKPRKLQGGVIYIPPKAQAPSDKSDFTATESARGLKICPLCKNKVREDKIQRHVTTRCALRPNRPCIQMTTKAIRKMKNSHGARLKRKKEHRNDIGADGMQSIFESSMVSAGRYGSSRRH
jgi:hypothetical protein